MKISLVACVSVFRCDILYCSIPVRLCETSIYCKCFNWFVPVPNLNGNEINSSLWFEVKIRNVCLSVWMATPVLHFKNQNILLFHEILLSKYFKLVVSIIGFWLTLPGPQLLLFFPVMPSITTRPVPEFYSMVDAKSLFQRWRLVCFHSNIVS